MNGTDLFFFFLITFPWYFLFYITMRSKFLNFCLIQQPSSEYFPMMSSVMSLQPVLVHMKDPNL